MKVRSAIITEFNQPLEIKELKIDTSLNDGQVIVKILASGVCGSDLHIFEGKDPRIKLPMIPGHEGVGVVEDVKGEKFDIFHNKICPGDRIIWNRGVVCKSCFWCTVRNQSFLCPDRKVYGISFSLKDHPIPNGCYSSYIVLRENTDIIKIPEDIDPKILVPISCSGATAYHAVREAGIKGDEIVVILGPGPIGLFTACFCKERGVDQIVMIGSSKSKSRLELARRFGVRYILYRDEVAVSEQVEFVKEISGGRGADVVFESAGTLQAAEVGQEFLAGGGKLIVQGIATPVGKLEIDVYQNLVRKNAQIKGVWVSDTSDLYNAYRIFAKRNYPFDEIVNRRFSLEDATEAIKSVQDRSILKAVIVP